MGYNGRDPRAVEMEKRQRERERERERERRKCDKKIRSHAASKCWRAEMF